MRQDLHPLGADALGRVMICTLLMAGGLKNKETFQLIFSGSGPLGGVVAISDGEGGVRGYVTNGKVSSHALVTAPPGTRPLGLEACLVTKAGSCYPSPPLLESVG